MLAMNTRPDCHGPLVVDRPAVGARRARLHPVVTDTAEWPADTEPSERFPLYTRGNVGEVFPNVVSVLTGTLVGPAVNDAGLAMFRSTGLLTQRDLDGRPVGTGVFGGYLYGNASLFRLMGVRTPGMSVADADEQVSGDAGDMPPYEPRPGDKNLLVTVRLGAYLARVLRRPDLGELERHRAGAEAWCATLPPLHSASDDDLLRFVDSYPSRLSASMERLLRFGMVAAGPRALAERLLGSKVPPGTLTRLVSGVTDVDSAQLAVGQWALSRIVAGDTGLSAMFDDAVPGDVTALAGSPLDEPLADFLRRFGHRCHDEYELRSPSWSMDPAPVLAAIDRLRHADGERDPALAAERLRRERADAERLVERDVPRWARPLVTHAVAVSRAGSVGRERAKDVLVRENLAVRLALHELDRRAAVRGGWDGPGSAFLVTVDELPAYVADPRPFRSVIAERGELQSYLQARVPPPWFEGRIPDPSTWPLRADVRTMSPTTGECLVGIGVSSGRYRGRARVVEDPGDPRGLEAGEVLVCRITDPSWTPLFLVAGAVVCETGAQQSHAAIVARELGAPGVMSVAGIVGVADGTWLDVDGDAGTVTVG
jgi:pyruvate,water dikinase